MNASKLPLNQKRTIIAQKFIIAVAERISEDEVVISYINLQNHNEVLRIRQKIETGAQLLEYVDEDYWDIYADGKYITKTDFSTFKDLEVNIKVTTSDKSVEIIDFINRVPQKGGKARKNLLSQGKVEM